MFSTSARKNAVLGLVVAAGFAETLAGSNPWPSARQLTGLHEQPWSEFKRPPVGEIGYNTQSILMSGQAILNSGSSLRGFQRSYLRRLRWIPLSLMMGIGSGTRKAALRGWLRRFRVYSGVSCKDNATLARSMMIALAIHGTGHQISKWIEDTTKLTHTHPDAVDGSMAIATLAQQAGRISVGKLDAVSVAEHLSSLCKVEQNKAEFMRVAESLREGLSVSDFAGGTTQGNSNDSISTAVLATFCFLRHTESFETALSQAFLAGGDRKTTCTIVAGLVGIHHGCRALPEYVQRLKYLPPHGIDWMMKLSDRIAYWPHGPEDLNWAPALRSWPLLQVVRNLSSLFLLLYRKPLSIIRTLFGL